jgi:Flp pilus assembly protein TadD
MALLPLLAPRLAALGRFLSPLQEEGRGGEGPPRHWHWIKSCLGVALPFLLVLIPLLWPPVPGRHVIAVNRTQTPLDAFHFLQVNQVRGHLYNSMSLGAAGMFYLYPQYRLYQSSYIQVEEDRQAEAHLAARDPQSWGAFLDRHRIDVALVDTKYEEPSPSYFPPQLWALVFFDDVAAVFLRRGAGNEDVIAANEYRFIHPSGYLGGIQARVDLAQYREGLAELQRALRWSPDSFLVHLMLGYHYNAAGERNEALRHFSRAADLNPEASPAHFQRGLLLLDLDRPTEAEAALEIYVHREPSDPLGYLYLATAHQFSGDAPAAVEVLERGLGATGEHANLRHHLGVVLRERGDLDAALANLQRAAQMAPNSAPVLNDLGVCLELRGDLPGAVAAFESALALQPDEPKIVANRERALQRLRLSPGSSQ